MRYLTQAELRAELQAAADEMIAANGRGRFLRPNGKKDKRGRSSGPVASALAESPPLKQQSVYVVGAAGHPVKVGYARDVGHRVVQLQVGFPQELRCYYQVEVADGRAREVERECHRRLQAYRTRGEWFDVDPYEAVEVVKAVAAR